MNYIKISKTDIANGTGVRCVLWVSGCDVRCEGCHNKETWDSSAGAEFTDRTMQELLDSLAPEYISGLTISGGHPLAPENVHKVVEIINEVRKKYPSKNIWLYTGYTLDINNFKTIKKGISPSDTHHNAIFNALNMCDVVVDGPYINVLKQLTLPYRGSSNQRLIDVKKSLLYGEITTLQI